MDLIDRELLQMGATRLLIDGGDYYPARDIDRAAKVDAVYAAGGCYCRECQYEQTDDIGVMHCHKRHFHTREDGFCSDGKRGLDEKGMLSYL